MKKATYIGLDRKKFTIQYDPEAPCRICGLPVIAASMGGTDVCPWCDCGKYRDGTSWSLTDSLDIAEIRRKAKKHAELQKDSK